MLRLLLPLSLALLAGCGPLVDGEVIVNDICSDADALQFDAAPDQGPTHGTLQQQLSLVIPEELRKQVEGVDARIELTGVSFTVDGMPDVSFIHSANVSAEIDGEQKGLAWGAPQHDPSDLLTLRPVDPVDVTPLVKDSTAQVTAQIAADFPKVSWTVKPRACFRATLHVAWSPKLSPKP